MARRSRRERPPALAGWARPGLLLALALLSTACQAEPRGRLELSLGISRADLAGLDGLWLDPDWAGASRHVHRDAGWRRIPLVVDALQLEIDADRPTVIAAGSLPPGHYDRVLVSTPIVRARDASGQAFRLTSHIEPIARGFDLAAGETVRIAIELVVRPAAKAQAPHEIFVKHAEIIEPPQRAGGAR